MNLVDSVGYIRRAQKGDLVMKLNRMEFYGKVEKMLGGS